LALHRLRPSTISDEAIAQELAQLVSSLKAVIGDRLVKVIQFGSSTKGSQSMHQYSDADLCIVVKNETDVKGFYGKLPSSKLLPIDWLIVCQDEFDDHVRKQHGVYHIANEEGRILWNVDHDKV
jgi:predicted nucleotidyltransferase